MLRNLIWRDVRCSAVKGVRKGGGGERREINTNEISEAYSACVDTRAGGAAHPLPVLAAAAQGGSAHRPATAGKYSIRGVGGVKQMN